MTENISMNVLTFLVLLRCNLQVTPDRRTLANGKIQRPPQRCVSGRSTKRQPPHRGLSGQVDRREAPAIDSLTSVTMLIV